MGVLFVSDLHLDASQPEIGDQFLSFLGERAETADSLYILGDLFESWVGDDDPQPERERIEHALARTGNSGIPCYFMRGNRDFLIGEAFARQAGLTLLDDEVVIDLYGERVLLLHGDSLCIDDNEYQAYRSIVRNPAWQDSFLTMPLSQRLAMAEQARARSREHNANAAEQIMDVNQTAVEARLRHHGVKTMLHGHTHRPAIHEFALDGETAQRIVLGDWYEQGSLVSWGEKGYELEFLARPDPDTR